MLRHIIICISIILFVVVLNIITGNYTQSSIEELKISLNDLKEKILTSKEINSNEIDDVITLWDDKYEVLSYYLEHDELEKVKTELVSLKANIETNQEGQAAADINRGIFLLDHINQKTALQVKNIF